MSHPTPLQIQIAIAERINRDCAENPNNPIPARAYRLVREGIALANKRHDEEQNERIA